jgi:lysophospholipase L1-like esterase
VAVTAGSLTYALTDGADSYSLTQAEVAATRALVSGAGIPSMSLTGHAQSLSPSLNANGNGNKNILTLQKETAPGAYYAVRVVYRNHSTDAGGVTLFGCVVAATETADSSDAATTGTKTYHPIVGAAAVDALDSAADAYGWRTVTWAGSSTPTFAAATSATQPTVNRSDWIPLMSVPRTDSGETLPLIMCRVGCNNTNITTGSYFVSSSTGETRSAENMGRLIQGRFQTDATGVFVTAPQSNSPASGLNQTVGPIGFEFMLVRRAVSIWFIGDSTVAGNVIPTDKVSNWGRQACAILTDTYGKAASSVNYGYSSQLAATYWDKTAKPYLATYKPQFAVYQVIGHNDWGSGSSASTAAFARVHVQRCMGKALEFVETCRENGIVPVLLTSPGDSSISTAAADAVRLALNVTIKAMGVPYIDMAVLLDNDASPARITAGYNSGDDIHPSIAGIAAQAVLAASVLKTLIV